MLERNQAPNADAPLAGQQLPLTFVRDPTSDNHDESISLGKTAGDNLILMTDADNADS